MRMEIKHYEWDENGELINEDEYILEQKKGDDGLMHTVKKEFRVIKGKRVDMSKNWKRIKGRL